MTAAARALAAILLGALFAAAPALAHKSSDAYLTLSVSEAGEVRGRWDIALRDLELAVGLDGDADGRLTWGEVRAQRDAIAAHALARLRLSVGRSPCTGRIVDLQVDRHTDGAYAVLHLAHACAREGDLSVDYGLLFDVDPQHRGLLRVDHDGATATAVLSPERSRFVLADAPDSWRALGDFVREGVWHIWIGFDHVAFLCCLLLPAAVRRVGGSWRAVESRREAVGETLRVVTAFTAAHSLTLGLGALGLLDVPSRVVESAIAASIVVTALDNLRPFLRAPRAAVAFAFGLVHGLGFASVLGDLGLPGGARAIALLGFNLGVELGQIAIVAALLPIALALRRNRLYPRVALGGGSLAMAVLASAWLWERAAGV